MWIWLIAACIGALLSLSLGWFLRRLHLDGIRKEAQTEAELLLETAKSEAEELELQSQQDAQDYEQSLWAEVDAELVKYEDSISYYEKENKKKKRQLESRYRELQRNLDVHTKDIERQEESLKALERKHQKVFEQASTLRQEYLNKLCQKTESSKDEVLKLVEEKLIQEAEQDATRRANYLIEEELKEEAQTKARQIFDIALDRFHRPYCSERGISGVSFPNNKAKQQFLDPQENHKQTIEEVCGCDIVIYDESDNIGIAGFDPVRREHTRRTLERVLKDKKITAERIRKHAADKKQELFKQIKNDGNRLAKELELENLHPEIRQMMGSLRYRYSFTQNQHFHCGEVGWLCGLLASELGADMKVARRSGMLHDIGKSMDHAAEGGHAVIGASFIQERGEPSEVVHAVRAHHFDEQPNSDIAFLVIAADAISGARPGARRSTMESYTQKINELDSIARSFSGVQDCFILNGGREVRVIADGHRINDAKAIELSRDIAHRIEEECNYPGQIRVVVVRERQAVEHTKERVRA